LWLHTKQIYIPMQKTRSVVKIWLKKFLTIVHKIPNSVKTNENVKVRLWGTFSWMSLMQWNWKLGSLWLRFWITIEDVFDSNVFQEKRAQSHRNRMILIIIVIKFYCRADHKHTMRTKVDKNEKRTKEWCWNCFELLYFADCSPNCFGFNYYNFFVTIAHLSVCQVCRQQNAWSHLLTDYRFCCTR